MLTRRALVARSLAATAVVALSGQALFSGSVAYADSVAIPPNAPWQAHHNLTSSDYQTAFDQLGSQGYRLVDLSGYELNGEVRYAAIWVQFNGPAWVARHGLSSADYQALFNTLPNQGFRPIHVSAYSIGGTPQFASIWLQDGTPSQARHGLSADDYQAQFDQWAKQGYRLIDVSGYEENGQVRYAAIWDKSSGPGWVAHHGLTADDHRNLFLQLTGNGYRPVRVNGYGVGGVDYYASIWQQTSAPKFGAEHGVIESDYQNTFDRWAYQGYRPVQVSGCTGRGFTRLAGIFENHGFADADLTAMEAAVQTFVGKYPASGLSLAMAKDDRLLYARGVGSLDNAGNTPTAVKSVFRIASVTKPITATTVLNLVEQGKLKLSDTVFGATGILNTAYGTTPYGPNIEQITVQHLLQHTAGGWRNDGNDPMYQHPDYDHAQLISWVLDNRPLDTVPGTSYAYSNFGYCVLGRVIEQVTGQSYDAFVKANTLAPCGISDMQIAGNTAGDRRPDEANYYDQNGADPYGFNVSRMDSHGGWLASALDLVRFAVRVDGFAGKPDIVSASSLTSMTSPSAANPQFGMGWALYELNGEHNWYFFGYLVGTTSMIARYSDGVCCAAVVNLSHSQDADGQLQQDLDQMMRDLRGKVTTWPAYDLF